MGNIIITLLSCPISLTIGFLLTSRLFRKENTEPNVLWYLYGIPTVLTIMNLSGL